MPSSPLERRDPIDVERRIVLDDLNLGMLFVDTAEVDVQHTATDRHLTIAVRTLRRLSPAATAALLCRLLHHRRIRVVEIEREPAAVRLTCNYLLPASQWSLALTASAR